MCTNALADTALPCLLPLRASSRDASEDAAPHDFAADIVHLNEFQSQPTSPEAARALLAAVPLELLPHPAGE